MTKRKKRRGPTPRNPNRLGTAVLDRPGQRAADPGHRPVRPGIVSLRRSVPAEIARPDYAISGDPAPGRTGNIRTPEAIERMRHAGAVAAEVLIAVADRVAPGVTTDELDAFVHQACIDRGAYPSTLNYRGYPKSVCTSINEVICHGIPDSRPLEAGDVVNIDFTAYIGGVHGDTSFMVAVGEIDDDSRTLCRVTREAMYKAIEAVGPGQPFNVIGAAIEAHAKANGLGVVKEFIGHGIGETFHTSLQIPHYFEPRLTLPMEPGMTFTIEPMLTLGSPRLFVWDDDWTAVTRDGSRSAQYEHTILVTDDGYDILTRTADGRCAADLFPVG
jgi:methionyl aminopeptidase